MSDDLKKAAASQNIDAFNKEYPQALRLEAVELHQITRKQGECAYSALFLRLEAAKAARLGLDLSQLVVYLPREHLCEIVRSVLQDIDPSSEQKMLRPWEPWTKL